MDMEEEEGGKIRSDEKTAEEGIHSTPRRAARLNKIKYMKHLEAVELHRNRAQQQGSGGVRRKEDQMRQKWYDLLVPNQIRIEKD